MTDSIWEGGWASIKSERFTGGDNQDFRRTTI